MQAKERIKILDGFRCFAILPVLLFHFYCRWTPPLHETNYYPYSNAGYHLFRNGNMGVAFFFIISGFIIFYTLETCGSYKDFLLKRFTRLFPAILLYALLTYSMVRLLDPAHAFPVFHSTTVLDFIPSLSFTTPAFWNFIFHTTEIKYISGVYWSLWVEVYFYIIAGGLFFYYKSKFVSAWLRLAAFILLISLLSTYLTRHDIITPKTGIAFHFFQFIVDCGQWFNLSGSGYNLYFSLGIFFYCLYKRIKLKWTDVLLLLALYIHHWWLDDTSANIWLLIMIVMFLLFIYRQHYLLFLEYRFFSHIGAVSYGLYLLHESIGVIIIGRLASFNPYPRFNWLIPIPVIFIFIAIASLVYSFYEKPAIRWLRKKQSPNR